MDFERDKARIMDALLEHGGLQHIVDVGAEVLGNPVFVCDLAAQVLAMSHGGDAEHEFWEEFFPEGRMDPDKALVVGEAGIYERVFAHDEPVFGKFDFFQGRFLGARIRLRSDVIGMATLVERSAFAEHDPELLVVLCQAIVMEMSWQDVRSRTGSALLDVITHAIEGTLTSDELDLRAKGARLDIPTSTRVILISLEGGHSSIPFSFTHSLVVSRFPTSPVAIVSGNMVMLLDMERYHGVPFEEILSSFGGLPVRVGVGCPFASLADLGESYRQAQTALRLARLAGSPARLVDYEDWRIDDFMTQSAQALDLGRFVDPALGLMRSHDAREGTRFVETLDAYLRCANNAQATARLLGIHKNTMYARLDRMRELFELDFESGETCLSLALSLRMEHALGRGARTL